MRTMAREDIAIKIDAKLVYSSDTIDGRKRMLRIATSGVSRFETRFRSEAKR